MPINDVVTPVEAPVAPTITPVVPPVSGPEEVAPISSNYSIPEEPIVKPIENPTPIINTPLEPVLPPEEKPILVEEPVINETYYQPTDVLEAEEVKMPNIDFDAIAKSISAELDELEKTNSNVKVTPINEITGNTPVNNSSSIYVNKPEMTVPVTHIDLPKKIDLPDRIDE